MDFVTATLDATWTALTGENALYIGLLALVTAGAAGHVLDRVMGSASFGPIGNSLLVLVAIVAARAMGPRAFGVVSSADIVRMTVLATSIATGLLLTLGALKNWLLDQN